MWPFFKIDQFYGNYENVKYVNLKMLIIYIKLIYFKKEPHTDYNNYKFYNR